MLRYTLLFLVTAACAIGQCAAAELYRIRVENRHGGLVQVSPDEGDNYSAVGRVKVPANARITGFGAASYAPRATVAAVAVHGIRIKTGQSAMGIGKAQRPLIFSISPWQFAETPKRYGGHIARSSGIVTDIDAGTTIFRNLAPRVGSRVCLERDRSLQPLPEDYIPLVGDVFVILVDSPRDAPREVVFENRAGGSVTAVYADGSSRTLTEVCRPVKGTGRYDATTFTGVGAINTNHCGVITISTAPVCPPVTKEGGPVETRGGFMIQPYYHAHEQGETSPQVMVVGPRDNSKPHIEGTPPLFSDCIALSWYPESTENSCRAQVKIGDDGWTNPPEVVGKADSALSQVTAVRLLFPEYDAALIAREIARGAENCTDKALRSGLKPWKGAQRISFTKPPRAPSVATLYVDGRAVCVSNRYPYDCAWDTTKASNGLHSVRIEAVPDSGQGPVREEMLVLVRN